MKITKKLEEFLEKNPIEKTDWESFQNQLINAVKSSIINAHHSAVLLDMVQKKIKDFKKDGKIGEIERDVKRIFGGGNTDDDEIDTE